MPSLKPVNLQRPVTSPSAKLLRRFRRSLQSRSVLGLLLFGFLLVAAPLAIGLVISGNQIDRLSRDSEQLLQQAIDTAQAAREVTDQVTAMERAARQYRVLRDAEALANLGQQREALRARVQQLHESIISDSLRAILSRIIEQESELIRLLYAETPSTEWTPTLADGFADLGNSVDQMNIELALIVEQSDERLEQLGQRARATAWIQLSMIVPFAVILAIVFTRIISRPIRQLDRGIRQLTQPDAGPIPQVGSPRDLRALSVRLEWVRRRLLRVENDRQRLLGHASHELKTPLSALSEGVSLLRDELVGPLQPSQLEVIEIMQRNVQQLQAQIDTLLRYNRARSQLESHSFERINVAEWVEQALANHRLSLTARNIRVVCTVETEWFVHGDAELLLTALDNLVSNAVKYSPEGAELGVFASVEGERVRVDVADQGPGVDRRDREKLFDPFFRGQYGQQKPITGSGLGLAICRDLIRAHAGDVELVQPEFDHASSSWSTIFRISLPQWQPEQTQ